MGAMRSIRKDECLEKAKSRFRAWLAKEERMVKRDIPTNWIVIDD